MNAAKRLKELDRICEQQEDCWRELDATKNAIQSAARYYYSHKELFGKNLIGGRSQLGGFDLDRVNEVVWKTVAEEFRAKGWTVDVSCSQHDGNNLVIS
jgi:hypothetical protein